MVTPEKHINALYALQGVLIYARMLAAETGRRDELVSVLDCAEHLPRLLAQEADRTREYRETLVDLATRYRCAYVLQRFDEKAPSNW